MKLWKLVLLVTTLAVATFGLRSTDLAEATTVELFEICEDFYLEVFGVLKGEPLGVCQWDMALINSSDMGFRFKVSSNFGPE